MAIENRNLEAGTRLVGRYRKQDHFAEVVTAEDGSAAYRLADGREFTNLSAAGSAVMGGVACNGWRFWSLDQGEARAETKVKPGQMPKAKVGKLPKVEKILKAKNAQRKSPKIITRTESQDDVGEGYVRYFCAACLDTFVVEGSEEPETCPVGHRAEPEPVEVLNA